MSYLCCGNTVAYLLHFFLNKNCVSQDFQVCETGLWNCCITDLPWHYHLHPECHWSMTGSLELGTAGTTSSTTPAVAGASPLLPSQGTGSLHEEKLSNFTRWWFQRFFIFTPIWGRFPSLLTFFRWVGTNNQFTLSKSIVDLINPSLKCEKPHTRQTSLKVFPFWEIAHFYPPFVLVAVFFSICWTYGSTIPQKTTAVDCIYWFHCDLLLVVWELDYVFFCFTQCAHGFVKIWWCQWMCWMSRAHCDLLLVVWDLDCVFFCFTQCAHGFVKIWWCQWMCWMSRAHCDLLLVVWELDWVSFCFTQCRPGFDKIWWCQWMCWMSRAHCDLLLVAWVLAMAWDSVFPRARSNGVSFR